MADNPVPDLDALRASLLRLRIQAEWYRTRLQEVCDRIAVLEHASAKAADRAEGDRPSP
jgi:hypothetical protein